MLKILTLSGWGQRPDALLPLCQTGQGEEITCLDYSEYTSFDALCEALRGQAYDRVLGWSLGGQLALRLLAAQVIQAQRLALLCAPHQFARNEEGAPAYAMERWLFEQFYENYTTDPGRTAKRFAGLIAKGDARMKELIRELLPHEAVGEVARWAPWLKMLGEAPLDGLSLTAVPETVLIHGEEDSLVRSEQSQWLVERLSNARLEVIKGCAHAPHLHDAKEIGELIWGT